MIIDHFFYVTRVIERRTCSACNAVRRTTVMEGMDQLLEGFPRQHAAKRKTKWEALAVDDASMEKNKKLHAQGLREVWEGDREILCDSVSVRVHYSRLDLARFSRVQGTSNLLYFVFSS